MGLGIATSRENKACNLTAEDAKHAEILHRFDPMQDPHQLNEITNAIIGAAIDVHRELGPGLLESAYEECLSLEFVERNLVAERQKPVPLIYRGRPLGTGYRVDFVVEKAVIVEVKSIERLEPVHTAQVISYLRLTTCKVGLLLNFNVRRLADKGIKRIVHEFPE